jgi:hypothetical protein
MERQLNVGFPPAARSRPISFFAVEDAPAFHLGLAYDHFVAGGDSIVRLLQRLVEDYYRIVATGAEQPPPTCTRPDIAACSLGGSLRWHAVCRAGAI